MAAPTNVHPPRLYGVGIPGNTLEITPGVWSGGKTQTSVVTLQKEKSGSETKTTTLSATSRFYKVTAADAGYSFNVTEKVMSSKGTEWSAGATSNTITIIGTTEKLSSEDARIASEGKFNGVAPPAGSAAPGNASNKPSLEEGSI